MVCIIEVPIDQDDQCTFSNTFPWQLGQRVDQMTYSAIITTLNQSIKNAAYHPLFKVLNFFGIASLILPIVLSVHYNNNQFLMFWLASLIFLLFSSVAGFWWHVYTRRRAIQSSLIYINRQLNNHHPPLSVRMYQEPLEYDRLNAGLDAETIEYISPPFCSIVRMHKTQFAGRKLFIEIGCTNDEELLETFAVDIPIDLSKTGHTITTYCTIYPATLTRVMSRHDYFELIETINNSIRAVRPRWKVVMFWCIAMIVGGLMASGLLSNVIAFIGAFMVLATMLGMLYELIRYINSLSRAAIPARERANARLITCSPPMRLVPISNHPNLEEILEQEQLYQNSPMMLVVGYRGTIDHPIEIDNEREEARDDFIAKTILGAILR